jgi:uncharacterized protein YjbI with pentapeptide repeats
MPKKIKRRALTAAARSNLPIPTLHEGGRFDLTYRRIVGLTIEDKSLELSLFTGTILDACHFRNINFDRCDFAGTKFVNCTFDRCSLIPVEVRSCFLTNCEFTHCNLEGSQWSSTHVERSLFADCKFNSVTIRETVFTDTSFERCNFKMASITLDKFSVCRFDEIDLGDCTAVFLFFDHCEFKSSRFSIECVGYTYGLTLKNLSSSSLTYLGDPIPRQGNVDLAESLLESYLDRHWYVGACAIELNFDRMSPATSLRLLTKRLGPDIAHNKRLDWDELQFLTLVLQRICEEGRLPLVGIWPVFHMAESANSMVQHEFPGSRSFSSAPELVLQRLEQLLNSSIDQISEVIARSEHDSQSLRLELHLHKKPRHNLDELIPNSVRRIFGSHGDMKLILAREGSWIEVWQLSASVFAAIQVTLVAVNGMMGQLVKIRKSSKELVKSFSRVPPTKRASASKNTKTKKSVTSSSMASTAISLANQREAILQRVAKIAISDLQILDKLILVILNMPDDQLEAMRDYVGSNLETARVQSSPRSRRTN